MPEIRKYLSKDGLEDYNELLPHSATQMEEYVADWLDAHPEATTTVEDGSITGIKIADNTIPDAKLEQTGGVLSAVRDYETGTITLESGTFADETGVKTANNSRLRNATPIPVADVVTITPPPNYQLWVFELDRDKNFLRAISAWKNSISASELPPDTYYINFAIRDQMAPTENLSSLVTTVQDGLVISTRLERVGEIETALTDSAINGAINAVYASMLAVTYNNTLVTHWDTPATYSSKPMQFSKDIVIGKDTSINMSIILRDNYPDASDNTAIVLAWSTDARVTRIPAGMWFCVMFRNLSADNTITLDYVREHSFMEYYDAYSSGYINDSVKELESTIVAEIDDYPVRFGIITDAHYPSEDFDALPSTSNKYWFNVYRQELDNGCAALRRVAADLNLSFIVDLGDDAGYSPADSNVPNIIYDMTKMASNLRGNIPAVCINGNHEAFQNNSDVDAGDIYAARVVNQNGVVVVSDIATNYYLDDTHNKIRYVFFDTEIRADYTHVQAATYLTEMLSDAPSDYKFILASHRDVMNTTDFDNATDFTAQITPYISRILFHVTGHLHRDDSFTTGGLLNITFIAAGQFNYTNLTATQRLILCNTDKESSFAVVGYNPTANTVKVFGYGEAATRTFQL